MVQMYFKELSYRVNHIWKLQNQETRWRDALHSAR